MPRAFVISSGGRFRSWCDRATSAIETLALVREQIRLRRPNSIAIETADGERLSLFQVESLAQSEMPAEALTPAVPEHRWSL